MCQPLNKSCVCLLASAFLILLTVACSTTREARPVESVIDSNELSTDHEDCLVEVLKEDLNDVPTEERRAILCRVSTFEKAEQSCGVEAAREVVRTCEFFDSTEKAIDTVREVRTSANDLEKRIGPIVRIVLVVIFLVELL